MHFFVVKDGVFALNWLWLPSLFVAQPQLQHLVWQDSLAMFNTVHGRPPTGAESDLTDMDEMVAGAFCRYAPVEGLDKLLAFILANLQPREDWEKTVGDAIAAAKTRALSSAAKELDRREGIESGQKQVKT